MISLGTCCCYVVHELHEIARTFHVELSDLSHGRPFQVSLFENHGARFGSNHLPLPSVLFFQT